MHNHRSDYDFDVISGPSTRPLPPPPQAATPPRPTDGAAGSEEGRGQTAGACAALAAGR